MGKGAASSFVPILAGVGIGVATGNPMLAFAVASGGSALMGGVQGMVAAEAESRQIKAQAKEAQIAGEQRANEIKRQLMSTLGSQAALFSSRGVALGRGGPETLAMESRRQFAEGLGINRMNMLTEAERSRYAVASAKAQGRAALLDGITQTAMSAFTMGNSIGSLGQVPGAQPSGLSSSARNAFKAGSYSGPKSAFIRVPR